MYTERHLAVRVTSITFIYGKYGSFTAVIYLTTNVFYFTGDERQQSDSKQVYLLIAYKCRTLILEQYEKRSTEPLIVRDVKAHR